MAVVVTAPGKVQATTEGLEKLGFEVEEKTAGSVEEEDGESDDGSESDSGSDSDSGAMQVV